MALVYDADSAFFFIRIDGPLFTDGYALVTGGVTTVDGPSEDAALAILNEYQESFGPFTSNSVSMTSCTIMNETEVAIAEDPVNGSNANLNVAPPNVAILLEKVSTRRGRRGRGRTFLPAIAGEGSIDEAGNLDPAYLSDLNGAAATWLALDTPGERPHRIPQGEQRPRQDGSPGTPPILPWPVVTGMAIDPKVATQRRRLRR